MITKKHLKLFCWFAVCWAIGSLCGNMSNSDRWHDAGDKLLAAFITTCVVGGSYQVYMLKRTNKVYHIRLMVLNNAPELYDRLPDYTTMLEKIGGCRLENYFTREEISRIKMESA